MKENKKAIERKNSNSKRRFVKTLEETKGILGMRNNVNHQEIQSI